MIKFEDVWLSVCVWLVLIRNLLDKFYISLQIIRHYIMKKLTLLKYTQSCDVYRLFFVDSNVLRRTLTINTCWF